MEWTSVSASLKSASCDCRTLAEGIGLSTLRKRLDLPIQWVSVAVKEPFKAG